MQYRAEIDGLRALAVLPVILFHAGIGLFSGGYVGVDVFFVISGYLITTILIGDLEKGRFSLLSFYERRARRILPALFFVLVACLPMAWLWLTPVQMVDFSESLIAVSLFVSNILFWSESGYFTPAAELKPLLHTWSLAVEEQYYLFFPIMLAILWKFGRKPAFWAIVLVSLISLAVAEWASAATPGANFYLIPTRAWELFAGSIAAFVVQRNGVRANNPLSLLGLGLIVFAIFALDGRTPFPGIYALLPVVGTVLLVLFAEKQTIAARILSLKPVVAIGLVSYSAYLWHQPLFAFARIRFLGEPGMAVMMGLGALSLLLAYVSWAYVEQPFRRKDKRWLDRRASLFGFSLAGIAAFCLIGYAGIATKGFDQRLDEGQREILAYGEIGDLPHYREGKCFFTPQNFADEFADDCIMPSGPIIWGDSHAGALADGWFTAEPALTQFTSSACAPFIDSDMPAQKRPHCANARNHVMRYLRANPNHHVYLFANWTNYSSENLEAVNSTLDFLNSAGVTEVSIIGPVPQYLPSLPQRLLFEGVYLDGEHFSSVNLDDVRLVEERLARLASEKNVQFLSVLDVFCDDMQCLTVMQDDDGRFVPTVWDDDHLTLQGAIHLGRALGLFSSDLQAQD